KLALQAVPLVVLRPRHLMVGNALLGCVHSMGRMVKVDADKLRPLVFVFGISRCQLWHLGEAGSTSSGPELENNDLASQVSHRNVSSGHHVVERQLNGLTDAIQLPQRPFSHLRPIRACIVSGNAAIDGTLDIWVSPAVIR